MNMGFSSWNGTFQLKFNYVFRRQTVVRPNKKRNKKKKKHSENQNF